MKLKKKRGKVTKKRRYNNTIRDKFSFRDNNEREDEKEENVF